LIKFRRLINVAFFESIGLLDPDKQLHDEVEMKQVWTDHTKSAPDHDAFKKAVASAWSEVGCAKSSNARYVIEAIARSFPLAVCTFLDEAHCPGARGLSDADKDELREIRDRAGICTKETNDASR
jgi:hypothetical protein